MFNNLVTYYIHKQAALPANNALAYQYILAGNGVFIRAETSFFDVVLPIVPCPVRGLAPLTQRFQLKVPRIPVKLLRTVFADARRARRSDSGLNEVLYQFHYHGQTVQVQKPAQKTTAVSTSTTEGDDKRILCELHSHGNMRAFFSPTDNGDEQGAKVYAVMGKLDSGPEMRLRVGVYGYWYPLPVTAVFTDNGPFKDCH